MVKPAAGRFLVERPAADGRGSTPDTSEVAALGSAGDPRIEVADVISPADAADRGERAGTEVSGGQVPAPLSEAMPEDWSTTNATAAESLFAAPVSPASDLAAGAPEKASPDAPQGPPPEVLAALTLMASQTNPVPGTAFARRGAASVQFVDPAVTRAKFDAQLNAYRRHEALYRARGLVLIEASFPALLFMACVPQLRPAAVLFGVLIDYTNFDAEPPSVRIVDPFTRRVLRTEELIYGLLRQSRPARAAGDASGDSAPAMVQAAGEPVSLLQSWGSHDTPFLCVPGVREYHDHPGHSGDHWWLHRARGAGQLDALLNLIATYGIQPIAAYGVHVPIEQPEGAPPQALVWQPPAVVLVSSAVPT